MYDKTNNKTNNETINNKTINNKQQNKCLAEMSSALADWSVVSLQLNQIHQGRDYNIFIDKGWVKNRDKRIMKCDVQWTNNYDTYENTICMANIYMSTNTIQNRNVVWERDKRETGARHKQFISRAQARAGRAT